MLSEFLVPTSAAGPRLAKQNEQQHVHTKTLEFVTEGRSSAGVRWHSFTGSLGVLLIYTS